jgi:hypothetical protein
VRGLRPTLFVTVRTDLLQTGGESAVVQDYNAEVRVEWSPDNGPDIDLAEFSRLAKVDAERFLPVGHFMPETLVVSVGNGSLVAADLQAPTCWSDLASRGLDQGLVGEALIGEGFDLTELRSAVDIVHGRALIVNSMEIAPEWRGGQYGLLATDLVIRELGRCADVAALYPMKPGVADLAERAAANRGLSDYWGRIGFVDFNGIMIRDLASTVREEGL